MQLKILKQKNKNKLFGCRNDIFKFYFLQLILFKLFYLCVIFYCD